MSDLAAVQEWLGEIRAVTTGYLHDSAMLRIDTFTREALALLEGEPSEQVHDCARWQIEGLACANCNPTARAIRAANDSGLYGPSGGK